MSFAFRRVVCGIITAMKVHTLTVLALLPFVGAAEDVSLVRGNWRVSFSEAGAALRLENAARRISVEGQLSFESEGRLWSVVKARDAATDRLSLANPQGTVLGYVSFRGEGDRIAMEVLHRAGANFFPGRLAFKGAASVRADSFACRTIPEPGEQILNFADGAGDSPCNDSVSAKNAAVCIRHGGLFLV